MIRFVLHDAKDTVPVVAEGVQFGADLELPDAVRAALRGA